MFRLITALSVAGFMFASTARADDPPKTAKAKGKHPDPEVMFKRLDTNNDGKISKEEFAKFTEIVSEKAKEKGKGKKASGKGADAIFARLDANGDGYLSLEEFKKISEMRQKKKDK
jgi:Ca2+-binding EF-hand superfamily protein